MIDWNHFTPWTALGGGLLVGVSTVLYLLFTGQYAGISGIARGAAFGGPGRALDVLFVAGLVIGGLVYAAVHAGPAPVPAGPLWLVGAGGVLVGAGTALGKGCTSGHGVCGLGRLSPRSLVAVATFISTGMLAVFVIRHVLG